jgi:hypothetical protein
MQIFCLLPEPIQVALKRNAFDVSDEEQRKELSANCCASCFQSSNPPLRLKALAIQSDRPSTLRHLLTWPSSIPTAKTETTAQRVKMRVAS